MVTLTNRDHYKIVQITDMHLFADEATELLGYRTNKLLADTITHILSNSLAATPDMVLVTGDISQDETAASYQRALAQLERFDCPVYWIHGNHDNETVLAPIFNSSKRLQKLTTLATPFWDLISVDTCRRGTDKGYIDDEEYERFLFRIESAKKGKRNLAVIMHHHPLPVNTPLIDEYILQKNETFLDIIKQYPQIKLIICGHVHGDYRLTHNDIAIETCPATCFQWKQGETQIATENCRGYRVIDLAQTSYTSRTIFL